MGGLIGIGLAGQTDAPIRKLVINDVGPRLDAAAIARIGDYVGACPCLSATWSRRLITSQRLLHRSG